MKTEEETIALLHGIFEMPKPRTAKCRTLYHLARQAQPPGVIVELGTFHGTGAITLWYGSQAGNGLAVYTIDDYRERKGWAAEPYGPQDQVIARDNFGLAGITFADRPWLIPIQEDACEAAAKTLLQVSLLFWDLGIMSRVDEDLECWWHALRPGAIVALHDTGDGKLGCELALRKRHLPDIWCLPGGVWCARVKR